MLFELSVFLTYFFRDRSDAAALLMEESVMCVYLFEPNSLSFCTQIHKKTYIGGVISSNSLTNSYN